jgi:S1-C subfamily serine protease
MFAIFSPIRRSTALVLLSCGLIVGAIAGGSISAWTKHRTVPLYPAAVLAAGKDGEEKGPDAMGFAPVLKPALAAVVNISSSRVVKMPGAPNAPFFNDPFFRQFSGSVVGS